MLEGAQLLTAAFPKDFWRLLRLLMHDVTFRSDAASTSKAYASVQCAGNPWDATCTMP